MKKIIKAFEDRSLLYLVTFGYEKVHKKRVVEFYINATIAGDGTIKSRVGGIEVVITVEDIRKKFNLLKASDLDVSSHSFN